MKACLLALGVAATVSGIVSGAERRSLPWEKNHLQIGRALYRENCAVCHDIDRAQSKKPGPSFYQLFKRDKMPLSHAKVNRDYIKVRVKFGGPLMPAFRQWLSDAEINTLIDYVASK